jgi:hypothetical protein
MTHNVPGVGDVFAAAMKKNRRFFAAAKMWRKNGVGMKRSGMT